MAAPGNRTCAHGRRTWLAIVAKHGVRRGSVRRFFSGPIIALSDGELSVDLRDADPADVLQQIAPRALQRPDQNVSERYLLQ